MNLSQIFPQGSRPLYYLKAGIEVAIIPEQGTIRAARTGFKFDAPLSVLQFHVGVKALITFDNGTTGFEFELPPELAGLILERRNEAISLHQKASIRQAITEADAGDFADEEEVNRAFGKWRQEE